MLCDASSYPEFFDDLRRDGYHIFSRQKAKRGDFYPNPFPPYPKVDLRELKENDEITVRVFFATRGDANPSRVDSGYLSLEVESIDVDADTVFANILTVLPHEFALAKGTTIELFADELLGVEEP